MTTNNKNLKRAAIKYIRDKAKSAYVKDEFCYVCGAKTLLELHHTHSISQLFDIWCRKNRIVIKTVDDIINCRDKFIADHYKEIYTDVRTLCSKHHKKLHSLFGQRPSLHTSPKQLLFLDKLRGE